MPELHCVDDRLSWIVYWLARSQRVSLGRWGEWIALRYLLKQGWDIVCRNWVSGRGELDLVALDGNELVVVEVKTRNMHSFYLPEMNVTDEKRRRLEALGRRFRAQHEILEESMRFDLIAVETPDMRSYSLRHYKGIL